MSTPSEITVGDLLRQLRKAAGLTQAELAERSGLSVRGLNDLERGARLIPRRDTVLLLADALGLQGEERAAFVVAARRAGPQPAPAPTGDAKQIGKQPLALAPREVVTAHTGPDPGAAVASNPRHPSGTVTFLFTDIEGSTQLLQQLGPRYAEVLTAHQRLLRHAFTAHGGYEVDTRGDSFLVDFPTALEALAAAADATRALAGHPWPDEAPLRVRMGLHSGAPQQVGDRYVELDVHRAARIVAAGHGDQILLSASAAELARHHLPEGMTLRDLGAHRLKDLQQAERIWQAVLPDLPAEFPPLRALDARPHNLPVQLSALLGREREVAAVSQLLRREDVRLVTLKGPGGIGKTRLSLQVAAELLDAFPDGVWSVRLSRLTDPDLVIPTIAQVFELKESGGTLLADVLRSYLRDKHLLLVLDNFEQVVAAAPQIGELLAACPGMKVLVTSRVRLHLRGEHEYALHPLALPDPAHLPPPERLSQYAAVALFIERARAAQADFAVTTATAPAVAKLCARLDGLPLAIELAAARVKLLPPPALLKRLEHALLLLTGGARDLDERQQTMRNTLAWSYNLLAPEEQRLFWRLAVFVGGCTLEAAEAVCAMPGGAEPIGIDVPEGLSRLVDQSLIQMEGRGEETSKARCAMLHVLREYALEQLDAAEEEAVHRAHAAYFLALAEEAEGDLQGPDQVAWLDRLDRELDNVRAALTWAHDREEVDVGLRLAGALLWFWHYYGHHREMRTRVEALLGLDTAAATAGSPSVRQAATPPTRARALLVAGALATRQNDLRAAAAYFDAAECLASAIGERRLAALAALSNYSRRPDDLEQSQARVEEILALARSTGDAELASWALANLSEIAGLQGDQTRFVALAEEALQYARARGAPWGIAVQVAALGQAACAAGDMPRAASYFREGLTHQQQVGDARRIAECLAGLAWTAASAGEGTRGARLLGAAAGLCESCGVHMYPSWQSWHNTMAEVAASVHVVLGEEVWEAAYAAGRALSLEEAIAEALDEANGGGTPNGSA